MFWGKAIVKQFTVVIYLKSNLQAISVVDNNKWNRELTDLAVGLYGWHETGSFCFFSLPLLVVSLCISRFNFFIIILSTSRYPSSILPNHLNNTGPLNLYPVFIFVYPTSPIIFQTLFSHLTTTYPPSHHYSPAIVRFIIVFYGCLRVTSTG